MKSDPQQVASLVGECGSTVEGDVVVDDDDAVGG
jgi:hypothetical protein